jgi:hypothetical protein
MHQSYWAIIPLPAQTQQNAEPLQPTIKHWQFWTQLPNFIPANISGYITCMTIKRILQVSTPAIFTHL